MGNIVVPLTHRLYVCIHIYSILFILSHKTEVTQVGNDILLLSRQLQTRATAAPPPRWTDCERAGKQPCLLQRLGRHLRESQSKLHRLPANMELAVSIVHVGQREWVGEITSNVMMDETCSMRRGMGKIISAVVPSCFETPFICVCQFSGDTVHVEYNVP